MKPAHKTALGFAIVLIGMAAFFALSVFSPDKSEDAHRVPEGVDGVGQERPEHPEETILITKAEGKRLLEHINNTVDNIAHAVSAAEVKTLLSSLSSEFEVAPQEAVSAAIKTFLDSGSNRETGLGFRLGAEGRLAESNTMRVFLLDELALWDPLAAGQEAAQILRNMDSPEEWAVALRNYARAYPTEAGRVFLRERLEALVSYTPWIEQPTPGLLESFDVIVHTQSLDFLPLVGPLPDATANPHRALPGLYLNIAHGSRGITGTPLCADLLADQLSRRAPPADQALVAALAPERFILRKRKKQPDWSP